MKNAGEIIAAHPEAEIIHNQQSYTIRNVKEREINGIERIYDF